MYTAGVWGKPWGLITDSRCQWTVPSAAVTTVRSRLATAAKEPSAETAKPSRPSLTGAGIRATGASVRSSTTKW